MNYMLCTTGITKTKLLELLAHARHTAVRTHCCCAGPSRSNLSGAPCPREMQERQRDGTDSARQYGIRLPRVGHKGHVRIWWARTRKNAALAKRGMQESRLYPGHQPPTFAVQPNQPLTYCRCALSFSYAR